MNKIKKIILLIILLIISYSLGSVPILASDYNMSFSPPLLETIIKPGKSITQSYWLTNQGQANLYIPLLIPIKAGGLNGEPKMLINPHLLTNKKEQDKLIQQYPWLAWFSLRNKDTDIGQSFSLNQNEKKQLLLKINVPNNAVQDDYYAMLLLFPAGLDSEQKQTLVGGGIGSNILLTVSTDQKYNSKIKLGSILFPQSCLTKNICLPMIDSFSPIQTQLIALNNGTKVDKAIGSLTYSRGEKTLQSFNILPENILVQSQRLLRPADCLGDNNYCKYFTLDNKPVMGKIQIKIKLNNNQDVNNMYFYIIPYKLIFGLILLIILIFLIKQAVKKGT